MQYYTNTEAQRVLKVSSSTLKTFVDSGILKRYIPPGGKNGKYAKDEVDALAAARRKFFEGKRQNGDEEDGIRTAHSA